MHPSTFMPLDPAPTAQKPWSTRAFRLGMGGLAAFLWVGIESNGHMPKDQFGVIHGAGITRMVVDPGEAYHYTFPFSHMQVYSLRPQQVVVHARTAWPGVAVQQPVSATLSYTRSHTPKTWGRVAYTNTKMKKRLRELVSLYASDPANAQNSLSAFNRFLTERAGVLGVESIEATTYKGASKPLQEDVTLEPITWGSSPQDPTKSPDPAMVGEIDSAEVPFIQQGAVGPMDRSNIGAPSSQSLRTDNADPNISIGEDGIPESVSKTVYRDDPNDPITVATKQPDQALHINYTVSIQEPMGLFQAQQRADGLDPLVMESARHALEAVVGTLPKAQVVPKLDWINQRVRDWMQKDLGGRGMTVQRVNITEVNPA